jgi:hypothetical protein
MSKGKRSRALRKADTLTRAEAPTLQSLEETALNPDPVTEWLPPIAMSVTSSSEAYGDFTTGLFIVGASTSDSFNRNHRAPVLNARDVVVGVPILWWKLETESTRRQGAAVMDGVGRLQSFALSGTKMNRDGFPMTAIRAAFKGFRVKNNTLQLVPDTSLGLLGSKEWAINSRVSKLLAQSQSLSIVIETPSAVYVSTLTSDGGPPRVLVHDGTLVMKTLDAVLLHSSKWVSAQVGNVSLLAGTASAPDHHSRTFAASRNLTDLPDALKYLGDCLACGRAGDSREHCVPYWVASDHKVKSVVAPVFCVECNGYFGKELEEPISLSAREGNLSEIVKTAVFAKWALKTALALSAVCGVSADKSWMFSLREGQMPVGLQIFALTDVIMAEGYLFSINHFSISAQTQGLFLFTFAMNGLLFVVLRNPTEEIDIPGIQTVYPEAARADSSATLPVLKGDGSLNAVTLNDSLIERMTGERIYRTFTKPTPPAL